MNGFREVGRCRAPGSAPRGLAFDGTWLWYADGESRSLYALTQSGRVRRQFLLRSAPLGIAYYRRTVLVVSDAPRTLRFFRRDGVEVNRRPLPGIRGGLGGFDVRNDRMWLALDGVLEQRSLATGELVDSFRGPDHPGGLVAGLRELWVGVRTQAAVDRIILPAGQSERFPLTEAPAAIASDRSGRFWAAAVHRPWIIAYEIESGNAK